MKNLKKVLAFVTMFTMLLSVAVSAGTLYPDVDDDASYAEAVATLNALGIMIGDENGNFNPDASITRAETAAIVTRMKALSGAASAAGGTNFTDVAADHWAAGYINLAEQSGIINGYGDGTFGPSDPVTFEQVIKMIVAALGRTPEANNKGGYPSGYLIVASQEDITAGVTVTPGAEAPRSAVARLVFNALEVEVMEQVTYKTGEEEYQVIADKTLLKDYLKVHKVEGIVEDTYLTEATVDPENDKIKFAVSKVNGYAVGTDAADKYDDIVNEAEAGVAEGTTSAASLIGKSVSAYMMEDKETGDMTLIGIAERSGRNKTIVMDESQIDSFDGTVLKYFENETDSSATKIDVNDNPILVYNNGYDANDEVLGFLEALDGGATDVFGTLTLIDYDNDDEYDTLKLQQASENYVVKTVNATAKSLEDRNGNNIPIDVDDEDVITKIYNADGVEIAFDEIAEGNVITLYNNWNETLVTAYVSTTTVTGTVTEEIPTSGSYVIDGTEYEIAYVNGTAAESLKVGDEGTFYINVEGKIVDKAATSATGTYAFLYKALEMESINGDSIEMKYLTSDGVWETRTLASKVTVDNGGVTKTVTVASAVDGDFGKLIEISGPNASASAEMTERVFQFTTNSAGNINRLILKGAAGDEEALSMDKAVEDREYNASQNRIGSIYLNNETKVFSVPSDADNTDEDDYTVSKVSSLFVNGTTYAYVEAYDITNNIPAMVVAYDASADILQGTKLLVISKISDINNASGTEVKKIYGFQEGVEVSGQTSEDFATAVVDRNNDPISEDSISVGDVVIFSLNADGEIDKMQVLMSVDEADAIIDGGEGFATANLADEDELAIDYFGFVSKKANGLLHLSDKFNGEALISDVTGEEVAIMTSNASGVNVYEINLNNSNKTIQVLKGISYIDAETRYGKDSHWAYVREYDDAIIDIVVYRTTNPEEAAEEEPPSTPSTTQLAKPGVAVDAATGVVTITPDASYAEAGIAVTYTYSVVADDGTTVVVAEGTAWDAATGCTLTAGQTISVKAVTVNTAYTASEAATATYTVTETPAA